MMRTAFTLMEIMLVMALLVVIAAFAVPALDRPMLNQQLQKSGDLVRAEWAKARNRAMENGVAYIFRFQPGSGTYLIEPWMTENDYLESSSVSTTPIAGPQSSMPSTAPKQKSLPERISFQSVETSVSSRDVALGSSAGGSVMNDQNWSTPILFYPDGTSSNAEIVLVSAHARFLRIKLRGLTGIAQVSEVLSQTEVVQ